VSKWEGELLFASAGEPCATSGMPGAIDCFRGVIQAVIELDAVEAGKASVVGEAHVPFLAADGGFTLHEAMGLAGAESAGAHSLNNALVLEGTSLVDVCAAMIELRLVLGDCGAKLRSRSLLRSGLSKAKSGG